MFKLFLRNGLAQGPDRHELKAIFVDQQFAAAKSPEEGLRRVILVTLMSPRFLYREHAEAEDQFDRAARLSFALINSIPDKQLLEAARNGQLQTDKQVRDQAWRLVNDYRSRSRLLEFLRSWMNLERLQEINKSTAVYPDFTPQIAADLGQLVVGARQGRTSPEQRTMACNLGLALDDIAVAPLVLRAAETKGLGTLLPL